MLTKSPAPLSPKPVARTDDAPTAPRLIEVRPQRRRKAAPPVYRTVRVIELPRLAQTLRRRQVREPDAEAERLIAAIDGLAPDWPEVAVVEIAGGDGLKTRHAVFPDLVLIGAHVAPDWTPGAEPREALSALADALERFAAAHGR